MTNRERVIKALNICVGTACINCSVCPYMDDDCDYGEKLHDDLIDLLVPRVMTLQELPDTNRPIVIETRGVGTVWATWYGNFNHNGQMVCRIVDTDGGVDDRLEQYYGYEWRCWTDVPTGEQREATPWND